jgi:tRNA A37 threonylcarbamoyladenosine dehydratase
LQEIRKKLRTRFGFPRGDKPFGVDCVYSSERPVYPRSDGTVCTVPESKADLRLDCKSGFGTASFVTGTFGFVAAAQIVKRLLGEKVLAR